MSGRTPMAQLDHFKDVIVGGGHPRVGGVWQYYTDRTREVPLVLPGGARFKVSPCHTSAPGPPDPTQGKAHSS